MDWTGSTIARWFKKINQKPNPSVVASLLLDRRRSSIELKLHLLQLAQAEANDAKAEMEAKLEEARQQQQKLVRIRVKT
jgi:hypothetical protein